MTGKIRTLGRFILVVVLLFSVAAVASAQANKKAQADANKIGADAASAINAIQAARDSIPRNVLDKAKAIAVFPGVVKVAFGLGGEGGRGIISRRVKGGWSVPVFYNVAGGSAGFQIGASKTDVIMLLMSDDSLRKLLQSKVELGAEASVAAGPVGRTASASTDAQLTAEILSYSRSKGLFAGLSLSGAVITANDKLNQGIYSQNGSTVIGDTSNLSAATSNAPGGIFPVTLARHTK